eukprot:6677120-Prorocentrum_lima.AAC.1
MSQHWKQYIQLLQRIQTWGQGDKVPPPIPATTYDPGCSHQQETQVITVNASVMQIATATVKMN